MDDTFDPIIDKPCAKHIFTIKIRLVWKVPSTEATKEKVAKHNFQLYNYFSTCPRKSNFHPSGPYSVQSVGAA